jgi:hypothetical protein
MAAALGEAGEGGDCTCSRPLLEYSALVSGSTFVYLKAGLVIVLNMALEKLLSHFVLHVERHPSVTAQNASMFRKLLIVECVNTAAAFQLTPFN